MEQTGAIGHCTDEDMGARLRWPDPGEADATADQSRHYKMRRVQPETARQLSRGVAGEDRRRRDRPVQTTGGTSTNANNNSAGQAAAGGGPKRS